MEIEVNKGVTGVAVSGGIDSMVLLRLFMESGADFFVINVEHGIRGESSVSDSEFVAKFCREHGIKCFVERVNAPKYAQERKISVELAARELRYGVFERFLKEKKAERIALAHHADDNAETVLMRIFRGTGIRGLKGITDRDRFIRPLIKYTRKEIEEYAAENGVEYVSDETNADNIYTRNFIRNELMPLIKTRYPSVVRSLSRLSDIAEEADEFLAKCAILPENTADGCVLRGFFKADKLIKKYSAESALRSLGAVKDVEYVNLTDLIELDNKENNASVDMPFGITAIKYGGDLFFVKRETSGFTEETFDPEKTYFCGNYSYRFERGEKIVAGITFDGGKAAGCVVRRRKDGDRFRRVNGKSKLLSDFLNEKKLLKSEKDSVLVLAKGNVIYAVLGTEVAEEAKVDENTKNIYYVIKELRL